MQRNSEFGLVGEM